MATCNPSQLLESGKCFACLTPSQMDTIELQLLCEILSAGGMAGVNVYRALMNQSGTNAPVATVLENSIGSIVWARTVAGIYTATLAGAFPASKTFTTITSSRGINQDDAGLYSIVRTSANVLTLQVVFFDPGGGSANLSDNLMTDTPLEILVYP